MPSTIAADLQDLVNEPRHLDLEVVVALGRAPGIVEAHIECVGRAEVGFPDDLTREEIHVMHWISRPTILPDETHVLGPDEEGQRALGLREIRAHRRVDRLENLPAPSKLDAIR